MPRKQEEPRHPIQQEAVSHKQTFDTFFAEELAQYGIDVSKIDSSPIQELLSKLFRARSADAMVQEEVEEIIVSLARNRSAEFFDTFATLLDFDNPAHFSDTSAYLNELQSLYRELLMEQEDELESTTVFGTYQIDSETFAHITRGSKTLENLLKRVIAEKRGNYILNRQAQKLLEMFGVGFDHTQGEYTRVQTEPYTVRMPIFQVSKDQWGYLENGVLYVSEPSRAQEVAQEAEYYRSDELEQNKGSDGTYWHSLSLDRMDKLRILCPREVTSDMVMIKHRNAMNMDNTNAMGDYALLLSEETRPILEKDFGIHVNELTLKEQFYLLIFLKEQTHEQADSVQRFAKQFGVNGLRTFLTNSYDEKMSERIFTFAALTDEAVVKDVFASYASTLDNAENVRAAVSEGREKDDDIARFSDQLFEAFVRRSAHLFYGAEKMATSWYDAETGYKGETMRDLQESFHGIALLTGILADMRSNEHFTYTPDTKKTTDDNFFFRVSDKNTGETYGLKMFVRPRAQTEIRSKKVDGGIEKEERKFQARINIELSLDDLPPDHPMRAAFLNKTEYADKKKTVETSVIRFGFDLDDQYDPPRISFDMGRDLWQDEFQKRTGDVLGRILGRVAPYGHHLIESFDPKFSDPDIFAKIAEEFRAYCKRAHGAETQ